ncbi:LytTr DNA-binding domain-containing protein [Spirosoma oryzae]|uniref:LytTr DNA-binding domain-containing protein n=1 Tax=Spirosoma oryzae TaxID=1469603 RepID=A0A2T0TEX7_9BACT|nr:LytTR family DNA-binding domain-containing protein [Spirosoma oryzae]PRY44184.1 LytTr DNA-binding domain-containing protein [Spirosoma oryzae]
MKTRPEAGIHHKFDIEQVVAITADINYSYVYFSNGSCLHRSRTLKWYLERWPILLRIHKNALINVDHIADYQLISGRQPSGYVVMKNGLRLDVSHRNIKKAAAFLAQRKEASER